jgi:cysteine-rich repeat protein
MVRRGCSAVFLLLACASALFAAPYGLETSRRGQRAWAVVTAGATVLVGDQGTVRRIDLATGAEVATYVLPVDDFPVGRLALLANGDLVVGFSYLPNDPPEDRPHGGVFVVDAVTRAVRLTLRSPAAVPIANDGFGGAIATLGNQIVVGAFGERRAYLFDGASGAVLHTFDDPLGAGTGHQRFGTDVAASEGTVFVSAPNDGAVHRFDAATGLLLGSILGTPPMFGQRLLAAGGHLFVGSPHGEAAIHRYDVATGAFRGTYANPGPFDASALGQAMATDGTVLVAGDTRYGAGPFGEDFDTNPSVGVVYVFDVEAAAPLATLHNPTALDASEFEDELFGFAVAVAGSRVVIGDPTDRGPNGTQGALYVFDDAATCGDGVVTGHEICDDGNTASGDGCDLHCRPTACGNGVLTAGEACDDGNRVSGDGCDANCQPTGCGNGVVTDGEQCDDSNGTAGDGCSPRCQQEVCGNGILDPGEACDDRNAAIGDGCAPTCGLEPRGGFTCYRARSTSRGRRGTITIEDEDGRRQVLVTRPVRVCLGDGLTAPQAELTCYRLRVPLGFRRGLRRTTTVGDTVLRTGRMRTVCLPSEGATQVQHEYSLTDPTPNSFGSGGGFGFSAAIAGDRVVVSEPGQHVPQVHRFVAATGAYQGTRSIAAEGRAFGNDLADAGRGEVLVSSIDDHALLLDAATGAIRRRYTIATEGAPDDRRQIVAAGPYVLWGDPSARIGDAFFAGAVHVFARGTGTLVRSLVDPFGQGFGGFGFGLAVLGVQPVIAVANRVDRYDPVTWAPVQTYAVPLWSSSGLAAAGNRVLIGTEVAYDRVGQAALLDAATGAEVSRLGDPMAGTGDLFGIAAASTAGAFVVGAPQAGWLLPQAGGVHVFDAATGARLHTILSPAASTGWFGRKVAAAGEQIVVSQFPDSMFADGRVHVYRRLPLDTFACYPARAAAGDDAAVATIVSDRWGASETTLLASTTVCQAAQRDERPVSQGAARWRCRVAAASAAAPRGLTVRNAFGTDALTVFEREHVCTPAE